MRSAYSVLVEGLGWIKWRELTEENMSGIFEDYPMAERWNLGHLPGLHLVCRFVATNMSYEVQNST